MEDTHIRTGRRAAMVLASLTIALTVTLGAGPRADEAAGAAAAALAAEERALAQEPDEREFSHAAFREAIELFTLALDCDDGADPGSTAELHSGRGLMFHLLGDDARAIRDYARAIEFDGDNDVYFERRAVSSFFRAEFDQAIEDFSRAIELNRRFAFAYTGRRGFANFFAGNFVAAEADFAAAFDRGDTRTYLPIWRHLAARRSGSAGTADLRAYDGYDPAEWPSPVVALLLGDMSVEEVLDRAQAPDPALARQMRSEALFYIGEYHLMDGRGTDAASAFEEVLELGDRFFIEYRGAETELQWLGDR